MTALWLLTSRLILITEDLDKTSSSWCNSQALQAYTFKLKIKLANVITVGGVISHTKDLPGVCWNIYNEAKAARFHGQSEDRNELRGYALCVYFIVYVHW